MSYGTVCKRNLKYPSQTINKIHIRQILYLNKKTQKFYNFKSFVQNFKYQKKIKEKNQQMKEQKYLEIASTYQAQKIDPDSALDNSPSKVPYIQCRICLEEYGPFIMPCKCDGTMKYVHEVCLKKWASEKIRKQAEKDEDRGKGELASIHGIECQLCKVTITLEVHKNRRFLGCNEAIQNSEDHFLPFFPLLIINIIISAGSFGVLIWIVSFALMLANKSQSIDYEKYLEKSALTWSLLGLGAIFCILFMVKSLFELYHLFIKEEYEITRVISKNYDISCMRTEIRTTIPDFHQNRKKNKEFNPLQTMSTPTSPHNVNQLFFQNKLSLARQKSKQKQQKAKQNVRKKLSKLKEFKVQDQNGQHQQPHEESSASVFPAKGLK